MITIILVCASWATPLTPAQANICTQIGLAAREEGIHPPLAIAMAWIESRFSANAESSAGAIGPLQIVPRYFCPGGDREGCNLIKAGFRAIRSWQYRYPQTWLCHYNAGNTCGDRSRRYARAVRRIARKLQSVKGFSAF